MAVHSFSRTFNGAFTFSEAALRSIDTAFKVFPTGTLKVEVVYANHRSLESTTLEELIREPLTDQFAITSISASIHSDYQSDKTFRASFSASGLYGARVSVSVTGDDDLVTSFTDKIQRVITQSTAYYSVFYRLMWLRIILYLFLWAVFGAVITISAVRLHFALHFYPWSVAILSYWLAFVCPLIFKPFWPEFVIDMGYAHRRASRLSKARLFPVTALASTIIAAGFWWLLGK